MGACIRVTENRYNCVVHGLEQQNDQQDTIDHVDGAGLFAPFAAS